jgi:hypothetical protein
MHKVCLEVKCVLKYPNVIAIRNGLIILGPIHSMSNFFPISTLDPDGARIYKTCRYANVSKVTE